MDTRWACPYCRKMFLATQHATVKCPHCSHTVRTGTDPRIALEAGVNFWQAEAAAALEEFGLGKLSSWLAKRLGG